MHSAEGGEEGRARVGESRAVGACELEGGEGVLCARRVLWPRRCPGPYRSLGQLSSPMHSYEGEEEREVCPFHVATSPCGVIQGMVPLALPSSPMSREGKTGGLGCTGVA